MFEAPKGKSAVFLIVPRNSAAMRALDDDASVSIAAVVSIADTIAVPILFIESAWCGLPLLIHCHSKNY